MDHTISDSLQLKDSQVKKRKDRKRDKTIRMALRQASQNMVGKMVDGLESSQRGRIYTLEDPAFRQPCQRGISKNSRPHCYS